MTNLWETELWIFLERALGIYNLVAQNVAQRRNQNGGGCRRGLEEAGQAPREVLAEHLLWSRQHISSSDEGMIGIYERSQLRKEQSAQQHLQRT